MYVSSAASMHALPSLWYSPLINPTHLLIKSSYAINSRNRFELAKKATLDFLQNIEVVDAKQDTPLTNLLSSYTHTVLSTVACKLSSRIL
jgi:hypothetical protein